MIMSGMIQAEEKQTGKKQAVVMASPKQPIVVGFGQEASGLGYLKEFMEYYFTTRCGSKPLLTDILTAQEQSGCRLLLGTVADVKAFGVSVSPGDIRDDGYALVSGQDGKGPVLYCVGNSAAGVKYGVYRLIHESVYRDDTLTIGVPLEIRVNPMIRERAWMPSPQEKITRPDDFLAYRWGNEKLEAWVRLHDYFGFNTLETGMAEYVCHIEKYLGQEMAAARAQKMLYFNRYVGNRNFFFIWGCYAWDSKLRQFVGKGNLSCPSEEPWRQLYLAHYNDMANKYALLCDGIIAHWADPGGCKKAGCKQCDVRTPQQLHLEIVKAFQKYNPNIENYFSLWMMQLTGDVVLNSYWTWRNTKGIQDFTESEILPKQVGLLVGGPGNVQQMISIHKTGRKAGEWNWYFCDDEVHPTLFIKYKIVGDYYKKLSRQESVTEVVNWSQCEENRNGDWNTIAVWAGGALMLDSRLEAEDICREFCVNLVGEDGANAVKAALDMIGLIQPGDPAGWGFEFGRGPELPKGYLQKVEEALQGLAAVTVPPGHKPKVPYMEKVFDAKARVADLRIHLNILKKFLTSWVSVEEVLASEMGKEEKVKRLEMVKLVYTEDEIGGLAVTWEVNRFEGAKKRALEKMKIEGK